MREKSRWDVDEPMSTPTLVSSMRSSAPISRSGAVNPPLDDDSAISGPINPIRLDVQGILHICLHANFSQLLSVVLANLRVFLPVHDRSTAFVDSIEVTGLFFLVTVVDSPAAVRTTPVIDDPHRLGTAAKVLMKPVPATGGGGNEAALLVLLDSNLVTLAALPGLGAEVYRPIEGVAIPA